MTRRLRAPARSATPVRIAAGPLADARRLVLAAVAAAVALACAGEPDVPELQRLLPAETFASVANETRLSLILRPPELARRRFEVTLPEAASLHLGYGLPNATLVNGSRAGTFRVELRTSRGEAHTLLERRLDPANPEHRRWFDARADLSAFAGETVSLALSLAPAPGDGPPPMGAWSDPVVRGQTREAARNVVVVSIDTLRARSLGAYGYPRETSPFLDALAADGALFENAITTSVTTGPSHMSLFTGLYPVNHGLRTGLEHKAPQVVTLAGALRRAGYQTAAFTENGYIVRTRGFGDGFAEYTENRGSKRSGPGEVRVTFAQARRWIETKSREPFHLFVHTYQVHAPFRPPKRYRDLFRGDGLEGPEDPVLRRQRDDYDREIRFVDDKLRELVAALEARRVLGRTLLVILADHGEEFHEHGLYQHGGAVYEESIRIPMIYHGPGVPPGRHAGQASLIDVLPTVLDYLSLPVPEALDGTSLWPAMRDGAPLPERPLFAEANAKRRWLRPFRGERWNPPLIAVRSDSGKFIVHRPSEGDARPTVHYDLEDDALERSPREVEGEELAAVDALVDEYLTGRLSESERPRADAEDEIDPELRERLRLLGYMDDGASDEPEGAAPDAE